MVGNACILFHRKLLILEENIKGLHKFYPVFGLSMSKYPSPVSVYTKYPVSSVSQSIPSSHFFSAVTPLRLTAAVFIVSEYYTPDR